MGKGEIAEAMVRRAADTPLGRHLLIWLEQRKVLPCGPSYASVAFGIKANLRMCRG
jgi:hypothetical protein